MKRINPTKHMDGVGGGDPAIYFECRCGQAWNRTHYCVGEKGHRVDESIVMSVASYIDRYGLEGSWSKWLLWNYSIKGRVIPDIVID